MFLGFGVLGFIDGVGTFWVLGGLGFRIVLGAHSKELIGPFLPFGLGFCWV